MGNKDNINVESLQFFGKIVASVSHEINNVMAIINEKAGLLKDLTLMVEKGLPMNPNNIRNLSEEIKVQIKRGDTIVKNMNKFAHSADEYSQRIDLVETAGLIIFLSERFASQRGVKLNLISSDKNIIIKTKPFLLEFLIWDCLQFAIETCGNTGTVDIVIEQSDNIAKLRYLMKCGTDNEPLSSFAKERAKVLKETLCAKLFLDLKHHELMITIPEEV